jgi:hypothetical protein
MSTRNHEEYTSTLLSKRLFDVEAFWNSKAVAAIATGFHAEINPDNSFAQVPIPSN